MKKKTHYLVTGGAGFIGSNIVAELVERGERVTIFDNFATGKRQNLMPFLSAITLFEGDVRSYHQVREAVEGVDYILHQAALPSVPRSVRDPITSNQVNVDGTLNLLMAARDAKVKRFVFASSSSVYGDSPTLPKMEDMPTNPLSPYAISKLAGEEYGRVFTQIYGFEVVALRYFNVFGPRQDPTSQYSAVIPRFITALKAGDSPVIYGDGQQSRDFTFVSNNVEANLLACQAKNVAGQAFNIACGERFSLLDLLRELQAILGTKIQPRFEATRPGDVLHSQADIRKIKSAMNFKVVTDFRKGLETTVKYFMEDAR
ncbi:SDR family oxidoreductase [bacterium]|nr:SDR family oxidoreductase [bacterium]